MNNKIAKVLIFLGTVIITLIELMNSFLFGTIGSFSKEITKTDINACLSFVGLGLTGLMLWSFFTLKTKPHLALKILFIASIASLIIYRGWIIGPMLVLAGTFIYYKGFKKVT